MNDQKLIIENQKYKIEKYKEVLEKWEKQPFFEGICDRWERIILAVTLENQRLMLNELYHLYPTELSDKIYDIIAKVFRNLLPQKLVSMQPMFGPGGNINYLIIKRDDNDVRLEIEEDGCAAKTKKLEIDPINYTTFEEEGWVDKLANQIRKTISKEIYHDLYKHAEIVETWNYDLSLTEKQRSDSLFDKIQEIGNKMHSKTLRGSANWIVTNSVEKAQFLAHTNANYDFVDKNVLENRTFYFGAMNNRYRLYADDTGCDDILIGYKGDSYMDAGYFYNPYIFLKPTPVVLDEEKLAPVFGLLTTYSKKLLRDGAKFYARLKLENFPSQAS